MLIREPQASGRNVRASKASRRRCRPKWAIALVFRNRLSARPAEFNRGSRVRSEGLNTWGGQWLAGGKERCKMVPSSPNPSRLNLKGRDGRRTTFRKWISEFAVSICVAQRLMSGTRSRYCVRRSIRFSEEPRRVRMITKLILSVLNRKPLTGSDIS